MIVFSVKLTTGSRYRLFFTLYTWSCSGSTSEKRTLLELFLFSWVKGVFRILTVCYWVLETGIMFLCVKNLQRNIILHGF